MTGKPSALKALSIAPHAKPIVAVHEVPEAWLLPPLPCEEEFPELCAEDTPELPTEDAPELPAEDAPELSEEELEDDPGHFPQRPPQLGEV